MAIYVCQVCGYVYDPALGSPETGVAPGTPWEELPEDWTCPMCGADKAEFKRQEPAAPASAQPLTRTEAVPQGQEMSAREKSALCLNLARGCEKQYKPVEAGLFRELSDYFAAGAQPAQSPSFGQLAVMVEEDLDAGFPSANAVCGQEKDRGALRALVWSEKVTRMQKSHLARIEKDGPDAFEGSGVYVCTICGFIYAGDKLPEICPVCKVPNWKFEKVEGRA